MLVKLFFMSLLTNKTKYIYLYPLALMHQNLWYFNTQIFFFEDLVLLPLLFANNPPVGLLLKMNLSNLAYCSISSVDPVFGVSKYLNKFIINQSVNVCNVLVARGHNIGRE